MAHPVLDHVSRRIHQVIWLHEVTDLQTMGLHRRDEHTDDLLLSPEWGPKTPGGAQ